MMVPLSSAGTVEPSATLIIVDKRCGHKIRMERQHVASTATVHNPIG